LKWYGLSKNDIAQKKFFPNYKRRINLHSQSLAIALTYRVGFKSFLFSLYIPSIWKFLSLRIVEVPDILILFLYSPVYFYYIFIPARALKYRYSWRTSDFTFFFYFYNNYYHLYRLWFNIVFASVSKLFFNKLKFKGKGYYIFKNYRNTIAFQFGYSHAARTSVFFVSTRFTSKAVIFLFGVNYFDLIRAGHLFMAFKRISIFTGRGMRFTRQVIYKKMGKISSYV
jgi:hypothetical protein